MRDATVATVVASDLLIGSAGAAKRRSLRARRPTVAVLGGGVGGLTAAHELAERGFDVTVYERRAWGGKARSMDVPGTARGGRRNLPAEHGWREIFSGYQNLPDTMSRIPFGSNPDGVRGNLVKVPLLEAARAGAVAPVVLPWGGLDLTVATPVAGIGAIESLLSWLPASDVATFARRFALYLSSGPLRRLGQWEHMSWYDFVRGDQLTSAGAKELFIDTGTRFAAGVNGRRCSARTVGNAGEQVTYLAITGRGFTRMLDAPTDEAWITPWTHFLSGLGVHLRRGLTVTRLQLHDGRVVAADAHDARGRRHRITADWFISALPVERARQTWGPAIRAADPQLARADQIPTGWMTGIQFYLDHPFPIVHGGIFGCLDSEWAVVTVSQSQLWKRDLAADYGDGRVREKLSAIVCDCDTPGRLYGKPAKDCTRQQVANEVWAQIKRHLEWSGSPKLTDDMLVSWFLDPGIVSHRDQITGNEDPLFLPTVNSWANRPTAATRIPNLFLAADYVQVDFDITSMEGANEAGRRAVSALLGQAGSRESRPQVFERQLPAEWKALRDLDDHRYQQGQPNLLDADMTLDELKIMLNRVTSLVGI